MVTDERWLVARKNVQVDRLEVTKVEKNTVTSKKTWAEN